MSKVAKVAVGELLFKVLFNKAIIDNKQTTRKLQDLLNNCLSKMGYLESNIESFILYF